MRPSSRIFRCSINKGRLIRFFEAIGEVGIGWLLKLISILNVQLYQFHSITNSVYFKVPCMSKCNNVWGLLNNSTMRKSYFPASTMQHSISMVRNKRLQFNSHLISAHGRPSIAPLFFVDKKKKNKKKRCYHFAAAFKK